MRAKRPGGFSPWTQGEIAHMKRLWEDGWTLVQIAAYLGRTTGAVRAVRQRLGIADRGLHGRYSRVPDEHRSQYRKIRDALGPREARRQLKLWTDEHPTTI